MLSDDDEEPHRFSHNIAEANEDRGVILQIILVGQIVAIPRLSQVRTVQAYILMQRYSGF